MSDPLPAISQLFLSFFRLGMTAFGGPSMVAYIRQMAVEQKRWIRPETFSSGVALCQVIPGATAIQTAAYVGLKLRGATGAIAAFAGFGLPSFLLMMVLSALYLRLHALPVSVALLVSFQAITVGIVANAAVSFGSSTLKNWKDMCIAAAAAVLFAFHISPILVILLASLTAFLVAAGETKKGHTASQSYSKSIRYSLKLLTCIAFGLLLFFLFIPTNLFDLALIMSKIDLFAFGGGFASVPLMFHEFVDVRGWIDGRTFMNGIILGQITPGPIVITATFIGYLLYGISGGIVATLGIFLPSLMMVIGIAPYFEGLRSSPHFDRVVHGILCSFVGLLLSVLGFFAANVRWDVPRLILSAATFTVLLLKVDILWVVLGGTIAALLLL